MPQPSIVPAAKNQAEPGREGRESPILRAQTRGQSAARRHDWARSSPPQGGRMASNRDRSGACHRTHPGHKHVLLCAAIHQLDNSFPLLHIFFLGVPGTLSFAS